MSRSSQKLAQAGTMPDVDEEAEAHYRTAAGALYGMGALAAALGIGMLVMLGPNAGFIGGEAAIVISLSMVALATWMRAVGRAE